MANRQRRRSALKVGIALGGGGAKGLAHIGVLKVLEKHGIVPAQVSGTSMGALVGALYCDRGSIAEVEKFVLAFEDASLNPYLFPKLSSTGLISEKKIRNFLVSLFADMRIEDLARPFCCTATDILSGEEVVFCKGSLVDAVLASISVPVLFPAHRYRNRFLVDGGLVDLVPVAPLRQNGADFIIAVNVIVPPRAGQAERRPDRKERKNRLLIERIDSLLSRRPARDKGVPNLIEVLFSTFEIMQQKLVLSCLELDQPDVAIHVETSEFKFYEFNSPTELIARGEATMRRLIGKVEKKIERQA